MSTVTLPSGMLGMQVLNPRTDAPTLVFASLDVALAACHLRGMMWHAFHGTGNQAAALDVLRQAPGLAVGAWREWAALKATLEGRALGSGQPTLPATLDASLLVRLNTAAQLGPRVADAFSESLPDATPSLVHLDPYWCWTPEGHWLLDALIFGDTQELQGLLDAGIDPNVRRDGRTSPNLLGQDAIVPLDPWSYCLSLVMMRDGEQSEAGLSGSIDDVRATAGDLLERCLRHGLDPATKVHPHETSSPTRMDQLLNWTHSESDAPYGWGRRWLKAIEEHRLGQAMGPELHPSPRVARARL